jgi:IS5 family transposase
MAYVVQRQYSINEYILHQSLNPDHELLKLAAQIDWEEMTDRLRKYYKRRGRRAKQVRLMVGLHLLKHRFNRSDETVVAGLHENIYWQAFCGVHWPIVTDQQGRIIPTVLVEASCLVKFRKRIGPEGVRELESILRDQMRAEGVISPKTAIVDTTAQEKHIAYPLDTHLLHRGRAHLVKLIRKAEGLGVVVPQGLRSFAQKSQQVLITLQKLGRDRMERIEQATQQLTSYAKHVVKRVPAVLRAITRRIGQERKQKAKERLQRLHQMLREMKGRVNQVMAQARARFCGIHLPHKLYSLHEPHVVCIRKGKRSRPDEYGSKVALSIDRRGYVVTHQEVAANVSDVKLLEPALLSWQQATGTLPQEVVGDRGVTPKRGAQSPLLSKIPKVALPSRGKSRRPEESQAYFKRLLKKRVIIEPIISHLKSDHRMHRCRYKGFAGDQINVAWAVMAWNTKKWIADTS